MPSLNWQTLNRPESWVKTRKYRGERARFHLKYQNLANATVATSTNQSDSTTRWARNTKALPCFHLGRLVPCLGERGPSMRLSTTLNKIFVEAKAYSTLATPAQPTVPPTAPTFSLRQQHYRREEERPSPSASPPISPLIRDGTEWQGPESYSGLAASAAQPQKDANVCCL